MTVDYFYSWFFRFPETRIKSLILSVRGHAA
ncbi:MAG: hypothetical protein AW07_03441 [Candidatus Accumulibacter sp. SK-11]|nr:MAG: hypothetical protein AW07_03441 [Candidatus Accumulibacter sp. SK-11]